MKTLIPLSLLFTLVFATPAFAEDNSVIPNEEVPVINDEAVEDGTADEMIEEEVKEKPVKKVNRTPHPSIQSIRHARKNPCLGMYGTDLRVCVQRNNARVQEMESRRTKMLKRSSTFGRRLLSIQNRLKSRTSSLDAPATPGKKVDLRARTLYRRNLLRERGAERSYAKTKEGPLVRVRTQAGDRKTAIGLPVCSRRDGLRLIHCMQEMGVEINEETVDDDTWKIYQRIYVR